MRESRGGARGSRREGVSGDVIGWMGPLRWMALLEREQRARLASHLRNTDVATIGSQVRLPLSSELSLSFSEMT